MELIIVNQWEGESAPELQPKDSGSAFGRLAREIREMCSLDEVCLKVGNVTTLGLKMEKAISAANANRKFSQVLREVKEGQSYVVTSHGRAVARIAPFKEKRTVATHARAFLLDRLRSERVVKIGRWKRDELYE